MNGQTNPPARGNEDGQPTAGVRLEIDIPVWAYGAFCEAAVIHGLKDWKEAARNYIENTVPDWANVDFPLDE